MKKEFKNILKTFISFQLSLFCILSDIPSNYLGIEKFFLIILPAAVIFNEPSKTVGEMIQSTGMFLFSAIATTVFSIFIVEPLRKISMLLVVVSLFFFLFLISFIRQLNRVKFRAPCNAAFSLVIVNALSGNQIIVNDEFAVFRPLAYLKVYCLAALITFLCNLLLFPSFAIEEYHTEIEKLFHRLSLVYSEQREMLLRILQNQTDEMETVTSTEPECSDSFLEEPKPAMFQILIKYIKNTSQDIVVIEKLLREAETEFSYSTFDYSKYKDFMTKTRSLVSVLKLLDFPFQKMLRKRCFRINRDFPLLFQQLIVLEGISQQVCREISQMLCKSFGVDRKQNTEPICFSDSSCEKENFFRRIEKKETRFEEASSILKEIKTSLDRHREQSIQKTETPLPELLMDFEELEILYSIFFELQKQLRFISELEDGVRIFQKRKGFYFPRHFFASTDTLRSEITPVKEARNYTKNVRYSLLHSLVVCLFALLAIFPETRIYFMRWKGHWTLLAVCVVFSPTTGESSGLGIWRITGSISGGIWAVVVWVICGESMLFLVLSSPFVFLFLFINYTTSRNLLCRASLTTFSAITARKIAEVSQGSPFVFSIGVLTLQRTTLICFGVLISVWTSVFLSQSFASTLLKQEICVFLTKAKRFFCRFFDDCELLSYLSPENQTQPVFDYCQTEGMKTDLAVGTIAIQRQLRICSDLIPAAENEGFVYGLRINKEDYAEYLKRCEGLVVRLAHVKEIIDDVHGQISQNKSEKKPFLVVYDQRRLSFLMEETLRMFYFSFCSFSSGTVLSFQTKQRRETTLGCELILKQPGNASSFVFFLMEMLLRDLCLLRELETRIFPCF